MRSPHEPAPRTARPARAPMAAPGRAGAPALGGGVRRAARARPGRRDPVQARPHRRAPGGIRAPRPVLRVGAGRLADPPAAGARAADRPPGRRRDGRGGWGYKWLLKDNFYWWCSYVKRDEYYN